MAEPQVDYDALASKHGGRVFAAPSDAPSGPTTGDLLARRQMASSDAPDGDPSLLDKLTAALGPLAHPQTMTDFAQLLTLPVDTVRKAAIAALAKAPVGDAMTSFGRGVERVANSVDKPARYMGAYELLHDIPKGIATMAGPSALRVVGQALQRGGSALSGAADTLSVADEASLYKQGYTPKQVAELRSRLAAGTARRMDAPTAAAPASPPESVPGAPGPPAAAAAGTPAPPPTAAAPPVVPPAAPGSPGPAVAARPRVTGLSAAETAELSRLSKQGKSLKESLDLIQAQREFQARFGLTTPTVEETRFPKGMRGKPYDQ